MGGTTTGKETAMDARLNFYGSAVTAKFAKYINSAGAVVTESDAAGRRHRNW